MILHPQKGRTALHIAAASGNEDIISILIENGSILNAKDKRGDRPLHVATSGKHPRVVLLLLQKGAHVNVTNHVRNIFKSPFYAPNP